MSLQHSSSLHTLTAYNNHSLPELGGGNHDEQSAARDSGSEHKHGGSAAAGAGAV